MPFLRIFPVGRYAMPTPAHPRRTSPVWTGPRPARVMAGGALLLLLGARLAMAQSTEGRPTPAQRDSLRAISQEARRMARNRTAPDSVARRQRTEAAVPSAFADSVARATLQAARLARLRQDSALVAYRATTTQRMAAGLGARRLGLEKLLFQGDNVARIAWRRGVGVRVTPLGSRMVVPMASRTAGQFYGAVSVPYFPGREQLWFPSDNFGTVRAEIDEREYIHPIAQGAEAYYRYATGDSAAITLPDGQRLALRELRITARRPDHRLFVGSFWFDLASGQLVRAAYRAAVPFEIWDVASEETARDQAERTVANQLRDSLMHARLPADVVTQDSVQRAARARRAGREDDEPPALVKALFRPARAQLEGITVEYGLHEGRFWLPRQHSASFIAEFGALRLPFTIDESYQYESVNGDFALAAIPSATVAPAPGQPAIPDTTVVAGAEVRVSVSVGAGPPVAEAGTGRKERPDSALSPSERAKRRLCARDSVYTRVESRYDGALRIAFDVPCDERTLETAAVLPPLDARASQRFDGRSRDALLQSLGLDLQAAFLPQRPTIRTGSDLLRYNRIEALSVGVQLQQQLGAGYTVTGTTRFGVADRHANGELALSRQGGARTVTGTLYHRLSAVNPEWASALSFGASLPAILYGRDEGFYYRNYGVSLGESREQRHGRTAYGLFVERQWTAGDSSVRNTWSFARWLNGRRFRENIEAEPAALAGAQGTWSRAWIDRPTGLRFVTVGRGEAATGTYEFARATMEATASQSFGPLRASLSGTIGGSLGRVPVQRLWFVGGLQTVRGQLPGTQAGDAVWLGRGELGTRQGFVRPVLFFDVGWSGSRRSWGQVQPQRGAGAGFGFLDGLFRVDIARGVYPFKGWRTDFYLGAPL